MATKQVVVSKRERTRFSDEFKKQALLRAVSEGVPEAARGLGLQPAQLYAWRAKAQQTGQNEEVQRLQHCETARLKRELARLEEENAFLKKAAAYFAKQSK
jgi:transposase